MQRFADHSTGILTSCGYIAVDIDVREPDATAKLERLAQGVFWNGQRRAQQARN